MAVQYFNELPDDARLWIFGANRELTGEEAVALDYCMAEFMHQWHAHRQELSPGWMLRYNRFLFIGLDESEAAASGCSIDSMIHNLKKFEQQSGISFTGTTGDIFYRDSGGSIRRVNRTAFRELAMVGAVQDATIVFDNTLETVGEFRDAKWQVPTEHSWHRQVAGLAA